MSTLSLDWLPWRFWFSAAGSTVILILGLLAVGAIDEGAAGDGAGVRALPRHMEAAPGRTSVPGHRR